MNPGYRWPGRGRVEKKIGRRFSQREIKGVEKKKINRKLRERWQTAGKGKFQGIAEKKDPDQEEYDGQTNPDLSLDGL